MVNFRHVRITNRTNTDAIDLNDFDGYLMTAPKGFGIYRVSEYLNVGNQRFNVSNKPAFNKISMTIQIMSKKSEQEAKYAYLRDFISRYIREGFRLYYKPEETERYIECDINVVDKTEKDLATLPIGLEITPLSLWKEDDKKISTQQVSGVQNPFEFSTLLNYTIDEEGTQKEFGVAQFNEVQGVTDEYGRPYYAIEFGDNLGSDALLINKGSEEVSTIIRVYGPVLNPFIRLYKKGQSNVSQYISFTDLFIQDGNYLEINSSVGNSYIEEVNSLNGLRVNREDFVNLESNMFIRLPVGNWIISISDDGGVNKCFAEIFYSNEYYGG